MSDKLKELSRMANIAETLDEFKLSEIAQEALDGYNEDLRSMSTFLEDAAKIMDIVKLKSEEKNAPFRKAANIKYPIITTAIIQFASRTLPEVIKEDKAVRPKIFGKDPQELKFRKGKRSTDYMNYMLLEDSDVWIEETDRLFHHAAAIGTVFKKSYYDPVRRKIYSKLVPYNQLIVNNNITSLEEAPRVTHVVELSVNDILAGQREGYYTEMELSELQALEDQAKNENEGYFNPEFLEQHTWLDLDEDGYKEPYMVLFHPESLKILRIRANYIESDIRLNAKGKVVEIIPQKFFSDFHFIPNPDGTFFSLGFGTLLLSTNATVNSLYNQLVNSGTLANYQGGFIGKGVRLAKKNVQMELGEWIQAEAATGTSLKDEIVPLNYKEPSVVLLNLLTFLIQSAKDLTSTTEVLTGTADTQNSSPTTILALMQQSLKVFTVIQKRMNRGLKKEYKILYRLFGLHTKLEDYLRVLDLNEQEILEATQETGEELFDFDYQSCDVGPVSDFNSATDTEKLLQTRAIIEMLQYGGPYLNMREVLRRNLVAINVENPDALLKTQEELQGAPNVDLIKLQSDIDKAGKELELSKEKLAIEWYKAKTSGIKNIADAEAAEAGTQLQMYQQVGDQMLREYEIRVGQAESRASTDVEAPPSDQGAI